MNTHFVLTDNVVDKKLLQYINDKAFTSKKNVKNVLEEMVKSFSKWFVKNDKKKARFILEG